LRSSLFGVHDDGAKSELLVLMDAQHTAPGFCKRLYTDEKFLGYFLIACYWAS
jgi:hypothetical protein